MVKETYLHEQHIALGAKMVDFAGWHMPVQYTSIIEESMHMTNLVSSNTSDKCNNRFKH